MFISTGKSRKDINWKVKNTSWETLCKKLSEPIRTKETIAEYHSMSKDDKAKAKDVGGFVGGVVDGGRRTRSSVISRSLVTLDADYAEQGIWERASSLLDYTMCCYSTHSHTPKLPRLRFIIPLDREITPEEYEPIARQVASDIGIEQFDITTYEVNRLMYWPSVSADGEYFFDKADGILLSADEMLARYVDWHDTTEWPISSQEEMIHSKDAKQQGDPESKPGLIGLFCRTYDIRSAIETFLLEVYEPCGDRYTYKDGSTSGGAVVYQNGKFLYSHHSTDPANGVLCNAFDLVRLHKFGFLDGEVAFDTPITKYPSYEAMINFVSEDPLCKEELINQSFSEARSAFAEPVGDEPDLEWADKLEVDKKGIIASTIDNLIIIMENDPNLAGCFAINSFTGNLCLIDDVPWRKCEDHKNGSMWEDTDDSCLRHYLEKTYGIANKDKIFDALNAVMVRHSFHPVVNYLKNLEWDGKERAESVFIDYFGASDGQYVRAVTRKWFTAAVARVMNPGCKFDNLIVLVGMQGIGKSYFGKLLAGDWFSDTFGTVSGKESYEQLKGAWILEMSELSAMKKAEVEAVKMFISKQEDNYRAAYSRRVLSNKRQCIFYGTTNDDGFLRDRTGNRRFWPIGCFPNEAEYDVFDLKQEDIDQLWAEVYTWYKAGEPLYLTKVEAQLAAREQDKYTAEDPRTGAIQEYLDTPIPVNWYEMPKSDRRNYIQGFLKCEGELMLRPYISAVELAYELYGQDTIHAWEAKDYNNILVGLPDWERLGNRRRIKDYGQQNVFERVELEC